ncbi:MAG: MFS transporter [Acidobacteriota bacterium]
MRWERRLGGGRSLIELDTQIENMYQTTVQDRKTTEQMPPLHLQVRWWILALLFCVTVINFVDRQVLSVVAPVIRETFHLSNTQYGIIVSSFLFGMVIGEFPMGWLMDRKGARLGLSLAVLWWSAANALHATANSMVHFSVLRFWLGTGECGNFSGGVKVVAQWFPAHERALAMGIFNGGSMVGSIIAPPLIVALMLHLGWRMAFVIPSVLGVFWILLWRAVYFPPADHPRLSPAEAEYIRGGNGSSQAGGPTNQQLLRLRQTWALMLCRMLVGPVVQFYIFWLPEYLYRERGFSLKAIGAFAWVPFLFGDLGSVGGGWLAGYLMRRGVSLNAARGIALWLGAGLCLLSLVVSVAPSAAVAMTAVCLVLLGHTCLSANMFATISDVFQSNAAARVTALTGITGGLSGIAFPLVTGWVVDRFSYAPVFVMAALMPAAGVFVLFKMLGRITRVEG